MDEDPYASLTFGNESILQLVSDLSDAGDETERVKRILTTMERLIAGYTGEISVYNVLRETNALREVRRLKSTFPPDSQKLCDNFLEAMRRKVQESTKVAQPDPCDEWRRLEKQLQERIKRKSDTEVLASLRRLDELIPERLEAVTLEVMSSCFKVIQQLQMDAKHTEVKKKAGALYRRWKELQSPETQKDQRKELEEIIPSMYKKAKIIKESEGTS